MTAAKELSHLGATHGYRVWSSDAVPVSEQFAFWCDSADEVFGPIRITGHGEGGFRAEIVQTHVGAFTVSSVEAGPHVAERDQRMAERDTTGRVYVNVPRSGALHGHQHARDIAVGDGMIGIIADGTPGKVHATKEFTQYVLGIPAELVAPRMADAALAGVARGTIPMLVAHLTDYLFHHAADFGPADARQVTHHMIDLVVASFGPATALASGRSALILQSAMDRAVLTLGDYNLGADSLAAHVNVSRRTLEKLFAERGTTVAHWILERRLERCRVDLVSPDCAAKSTEVIAQGWGFADRTHFSRVFKERYGLSPATFRRGRTLD